MNPGGAGLRLAAALAVRPRLVAGRGRRLLGELGRIAAGTSQVQPSRRDRRWGAANALVRPGAATMLGSPVDLAAVDRDSYQVAGITDHICPWQSCYRSTQLLGGRTRFVLSTSGHIAAMVNPPGNEKARYQLAKQCPEDPEEWLRWAETCHGSWWPDYASWLAARCGEEKAAPGELGGGGLVPVSEAPGTYVYDH
ncbi:MAG: hypothetical protein ACRDPY_42695 [Streptosporangiaceae bacterium]